MTRLNMQPRFSENLAFLYNIKQNQPHINDILHEISNFGSQFTYWYKI